MPVQPAFRPALGTKRWSGNPDPSGLAAIGFLLV
jgi:hypothetical protein